MIISKNESRKRIWEKVKIVEENKKGGDIYDCSIDKVLTNSFGRKIGQKSYLFLD